MAFSVQTKNELARVLPLKRCCQKAELAAILSLDGHLINSAMEVKTSNAAAARKLFTLVKNLYQVRSQVHVIKRARLNRKNIYKIRIPMDKISFEGLAHPDASMLPVLGCCRRAFLRGAFLARGSVNNPDKGYHLEYWTDNQTQGERIAACLKSLHFKPRLSRRKNGSLIYLKEAEQISQLLNMLGAHRALFNWEDVRIMKGMRNQVNRLVNCETANVDKTVQASMKQLEDIKFIAQEMGLQKLPMKLRELAQMRVNNPYASLKELGEIMIPKVSKSGVNHRMRQLAKIAEGLFGKN